MKVYYDKLGPYRNSFLIFNPNAGTVRKHPELVEVLLAELRAHGHAITPAPTTAAGHATELAREYIRTGADLIVVAGGDGTVNEVLNGMVGTDVPLAVLPGGTANVFCMETHIGSRLRRAVRCFDKWQPTRIALGLVRNQDGTPRRYFLSMAGAGLDAYIVSAVDDNLKRRFGKVAYWLAGFQSVTRELEEFDVQANGEERTSGFVLVSRVRNYGGDLEIACGASLLRDEFEVVAFEGSNPIRYLKYLAGIGVKRYRDMSGVFVADTRQAALRLHNGTPVQLQVDGELCGHLPVSVELVPSALTVLLPPEFLSGERTRWTT
ncbi:MAG: diacylglycerol kinase family lipid kinase [Acidobacteria bacterium]|nr:diacylglycerol kinase family lipid kinase [Acidobacteriota bacterium]